MPTSADCRFGYTIAFVDDVEATIEFYEEAFGQSRRFVRDMGDFQYGEIETGETTLAFSSHSELDGMLPTGYRANTSDELPPAFVVSFIADDVTAAYERAVGAGTEEVTEPTDTEWGQTVARVRDINGILVSLVSEPRE